MARQQCVSQEKFQGEPRDPRSVKMSDRLGCCVKCEVKEVECLCMSSG